MGMAESVPKTLVFYLKCWIIFASGAAALLCYNCENKKSNGECSTTDEAVKCSPQMDTCQTIVSYSHISNKMEISKTCTKNVSCELQINATRYSEPCEPKHNTWICTTCCYEDLCNHDNTNVCRGNLPVLSAMIVLTSVLRHV